MPDKSKFTLYARSGGELAHQNLFFQLLDSNGLKLHSKFPAQTSIEKRRKLAKEWKKNAGTNLIIRSKTTRQTNEAGKVVTNVTWRFMLAKICIGQIDFFKE